MAVVGSAEVVVRAITTKVRDDIAKAFKDATPALNQAGREHSKAYSDAFASQISDGSLGKSVETALFKTDTGSSGTLGGARYSDAFGKSVSSNLKVDSAFDKTTTTARTAGTQSGREFGNSVVDETRKAGKLVEYEMMRSGFRGGSGLASGLTSSPFMKESRKIADGFHSMLISAQVTGTGLATLVGGLSAVVSGLFSMASAASNAIGVVGALPGVIAAAAQAGATLGLAFMGVGKALSAGIAQADAPVQNVAKAATSAAKQVGDAENRLQDAVRQASRAISDAKRGVADAYDQSARASQDAARKVQDAEKDVSTAYQDAAQASSDAARQVQDAERDLAAAQTATRITQLALTAARKAGAETLQQLGFATEDAALAEQRAKLNLQDAFTALQKVQNLPPDSRMRQDAELAFKEAELNYREAKDRAGDLKKENENAAKAGVDGTKEVVSAKKDINDAQKNEADAEKKVGDARRDQAKTAQDNAQKIADANQKVADARRDQDRVTEDNTRRIADAQRTLTRAQTDGARNIAQAQKGVKDALVAQKGAMDQLSTSANKYQQALKLLSPEARGFVRYLLSIRGEVRKLRAAAGEKLFGQLQTALEPIVNKLFPLFEDKLRTSGGILGGIAVKISNFVTSAEGIKLISQIMDTNNRLFRIGGDVIANLAPVLLRLAAAAGPLITDFALWAKHLSATWAAATAGQAGMDRLSGFFTRAEATGQQLWRIITNLWDILMDLRGASQDAGFSLLDSFEKATKALGDFLSAPKNQPALRAFFTNAANSMRIIGKIIGVVAKGFLKLGGSKEVGQAFKTLGDSAPNISKIFDGAIKAAPQFAELVGHVLDIMGALAESDATQKMFEGINAVVGRIADALNSRVGRQIIGLAAPIIGVMHAFFLLSRGAQFFGKVILGTFGNMLSLITAPIRAVGRLRTALGRVRLGRAGRAAETTGATRASGGLTGTSAKEAQAQAKRAAEPVGKGVSDGLAAGVNGESFWRKVTLMVEEGINIAKDILKIKSPSLVFEKIGAEIGAGMANGMTAAMAEVDAAAARMSESAVATAKTGAAGAAVQAETAAAAAAGKTGAIGGVKGAAASPLAGAGKAAAAEGGKISGVLSKTGGALRGFGKIAGVVGKGIGGAMSLAMGPVGLIASIAIPLLIEGFKWLYKNSPGFRKFIDGLVKGMKEVFHWLAEVLPPALRAIGTFFKAVWGGIVVAFNAVAKAIQWTWEHVLRPPITLYIAYLRLLARIVRAVWNGIRIAIGAAINGIKWFWDNVLRKVIDAIVGGFRWLVNRVKDFLDRFIRGWRIIIQRIKNVWTNVGAPIINGIRDKWKWLVDRIRDFLDRFVRGWHNIINKVKEYWNKFGQPIINAVKDAWDRFVRGIRRILNGIKTAFTNVINAVRDWWNKFGQPIVDRIKQKWSDFVGKVKDLINGVKTGFVNAMTAIKTWWNKTGAPIVDLIQQKWRDFKKAVVNIWDSVKNAPKAGLRNLINNLNNWLVAPLNKLTKVFKITIPNIPMPAGLAEGGPVEGQGGPRQDNQLRRLSVGEFVLRDKAVRGIGKETAAYINRTGQLPPGGATKHHLPDEPFGGWIDTIKEPVEWVHNMMKKGAGKAWDLVMGGFERLLPKGSGLIEELVRGIWDVLRVAVKKRGQAEQKAADAAANVAGTSFGNLPLPGQTRRFGDETFTREQLINASTIAKVASDMNLSRRALEIALMTAMVESGIRNLAHGDADSIGAFQQRAAWGPYADRHNVAAAAKMFFNGGHAGQRGLLDIKGWPSLPRGKAAQAVQVSAFPDRYAAKEDSAIAMVDAMGNLRNALVNMTNAAGWTYPTRPHYAGHNWAGHNPPWGDDIGAPMGTTVVAANAGVVHSVRNLGNRSYGRYIVINHGKGVSTLYAHLKSFNVRAGQIVGSGQKIGISDDSGGSRGAHLHFEYRPSADTIRRMRALHVRGFAEGGIVPATPGGILSVIGEAGKKERVEPLDSTGLSQRDRAMIELLSKQSRGSGGHLEVRVFVGNQEITDIVNTQLVKHDKDLVQALSIGTKRRYL
jgi:murein DD-endopeptidase MepM/ murein hydrolase activator NlpD